MSEPSCPYGIQRVQQRSQWHQVTGRTKSPRMRLPDSEQHQETLSVSLSTLSASPLLLLVNMHASNIQQNQVWAFVSVLCCCVLYYAMIESQSCLIREAKCESKEPGCTKVNFSLPFMRFFKTWYCFKAWFIFLGFILRKPKYQLELTKKSNHSASSQPFAAHFISFPSRITSSQHNNRVPSDYWHAISNAARSLCLQNEIYK